MKESRVRVAELLLLLLPMAYVAFVLVERAGVIDRFRGLDKVEQFAANLETSYREGVRRQSRPDDPEWKPLVRLISRYSTAHFPKDRQPKVVARWVAVASSRQDLGAGRIAEWTAPTTPLAFLYVELPAGTEEGVSFKDAAVVGTIGDVRLWLEAARNDLKFLVQDVFLTGFTVVLGLFIWFADRRRGD